MTEAAVGAWGATLEITPDPGEDIAARLAGALARAGVIVDPTPASYRSVWSAAGRVEAMTPPDVYARSPRSTPGATRA